ncbi:MAG TPA: hypothetical protein VH459_05095 [Gaiellales bacterium]
MSERYMGLLVIAAYALLVQVLRKRFVADPLRQGARSQLLRQRRRLDAIPECGGASAAAVRRSTRKMLRRAEKSLTPSKRSGRVRELFSWSGSRETDAVSTAYEAERLIVAWLLPDVSVRGRLERARSELQFLPETERASWSKTLDQVKDSPPDAIRATIGEMLADVYARRDAAYSEAWSFNNKVAWFEWPGLLAALVMTWRGHGVLLFAGAVGGLLSRIQRARESQPSSADHGFSWPLIFLSPMAGAIGAWAGLYLILGLEKTGAVPDISAALGAHPLTQPTTTVVAVAILLGLSERFFDRVVALAEHGIVPGIDAKGADTSQPAGVETLRPAFGTHT